MTNPETVREVNIAAETSKAMIGDQIAELRKYLYWVLGVLLTGLAAGIAGHIDILKKINDIQIETQKQIGELRVEIQRQTGDIRAELQKQSGDLKIEYQKQISDVKTDLAVTGQTIGRVEKSVGDLQTVQRQMQAVLGRIETSLQTRGSSLDRQPFAVMFFDEYERQLILKFIAVKSVPGATPSVKVGDPLDPMSLKSIPDDLVGAVPRLKGTRFWIDDKSGSIVIAAANDNRVIAVVGG